MTRRLSYLHYYPLSLSCLDFAEMIDLDNPPYSIIDLLIWFVFTVGVAWRFFSSKEKWRFILENIFDLLAIFL